MDLRLWFIQYTFFEEKQKDQDGFWKDRSVINLLSGDSVHSTIQYTKVRRVPARRPLRSKRQTKKTVHSGDSEETVLGGASGRVPFLNISGFFFYITAVVEKD